jgi:YtkA-like
MSCGLPLVPTPLRYKVLSLFLCAVLPVVVVACRRSSAGPEISIRHQIAPQPVRVGPATISFQVADATGKPVSSTAVEVEADMAHPGMAPLFGKAEEISPGNYRADIRFNMPGDWVVLLRIKLPGGETVERLINVRGIQSN